eukprot:TRINITY_DN54081_c0_g1_i1.p1 TRINITY_DN54081_c0_g1~~TRINITY_DN54081_c0_g1_i1.p1  ORF type:complete len:493 (-),score=81.50 TRINITY_DN54081_c0_g1_i1:53-1390(-)
MRSFLDGGFPINGIQDGRSLLHAAAANGAESESWDVLKFLLGQKADASIIDEDGDTALYYTTGDAEITSLLLAARADPNLYSDGSASPLIQGVEDINVVEKLLAARADPNLPANDSGATCMMLAIQGDHHEVSTALLGAGMTADGLNKADQHGRRALYCAIMKEDSDLVDKLLRAGASVKLPGPEDTPLLNVVLQFSEHRLEHLMKLLLVAGADVNCVDGLGFNALHSALRRKSTQSRAAAISLAAKVSNVNCATKLGETALDIAQAAGQDEEVITALMALGAAHSSPNFKALPIIGTALVHATTSKLGCKVDNCSLDSTGYCPNMYRDDDGSPSEDWINFAFAGPMLIKYVQFAGRSDNTEEWTTAFKLSYSTDGTDWTSHPSNPFQGNRCNRISKGICLQPPIQASMLRLQPTSWHIRSVVRMQLYGNAIACAPLTQVTGSSQ